MTLSEFWVMRKKDGVPSAGCAVSSYPGSNLPTACIVELTPDELVYVWPLHPKLDSLCLVCSNQDCCSSQICQQDITPGFPCKFQAVPEAPMSQDLEDFLVNGDFLVECGYFHSFEDFRKVNGYSYEHFYFAFLGHYASVHLARYAMLEGNCYIQ